MSKRYIWKTTYAITNGRDWHSLQATWDSSRKAFGKGRIFVMEGGAIETNLPWSALRDLFSYSFVKFPSIKNEWLTDTKPSWEIDWDNE